MKEENGLGMKEETEKLIKNECENNKMKTVKNNNN